MIANHCTLDIETLSTRVPDAAVVSIGAVKFCLSQGIVDQFKVNISAKTCKEAGMHFDAGTIDWWAKQPPEARKGWQENPVPLETAIEMFADWYGKKSLWTWAKGGHTFDFPILENAFKAAGRKVPWKYVDLLDYRTIIKFCGINDYALKTAGTVNHDALSDCIEQTKVLIPLLQAAGSFEDQ